MNTILNVSSLTKYFGPIRALNDVNLSISKGEAVALIGDNGAGKSTLIKIPAGVYRPDCGVLCIRDQAIDFRRYTVRKARRLGIETVYQERSLCEKQPLWRNLFVGRHLHNRLGFNTEFCFYFLDSSACLFIPVHRPFCINASMRPL